MDHQTETNAPPVSVSPPSITDTLDNVISNGREPEPEHDPGLTAIAADIKAATIADIKNPKGPELDRDRDTEKPVLPPSIDNRYVNVDGNFFNREQSGKTPDIRDNGNTLVTKSDDKQIAQDMVALAESKGWDSLRVKGSSEFRQQVWLEASLKGIEVKGYRPKEADLALLQTKSSERETNAIEKDKNAQTVGRDPALSPKENAKVAAAEKVLFDAIKGLPEQQRNRLMERLNVALKDPANIRKLPDPQREARPQQQQRGQNRER